MIIDCHYHLEPELLPIEAMIEGMDREGIEKTALIAGMCSGLSEPGPAMLALMRYLLFRPWGRRIVKLLMNRFTQEGDAQLPSGVVKIFSDPDNEPVFEAVREHPERFLGWAFVNPRGRKDPLEEYERWKDTPGFVGVKAHPFWHRYPPVELVPVAEKLAETGKPLLIHGGFDENGDILSLLRQVPGLKLILAHAGFPAFRDTWEKIKEYPNVVVDLSATAYVDKIITRMAVEYLGAERCLFGTDGPFGSPGTDEEFDCGIIKTRIETLFPEKAIQKKLLGENFSRIALGLGSN